MWHMRRAIISVIRQGGQIQCGLNRLNSRKKTRLMTRQIEFTQSEGEARGNNHMISGVQSRRIETYGRDLELTFFDQPTFLLLIGVQRAKL